MTIHQAAIHQAVSVQELSMTLFTESFNPSILTPDFLKYSNIIPADWEPARPPVLSQSASQIIFKSGVSIVAQPNRVVLSERLADRQLGDMNIPAIAQKLIQVLSQVKYQGSAISFRGHVAFDSTQPSAARDYLLNTLLAPGAWRDFAPMQPTLQLTYQLPEVRLLLEINQAGLPTREESVTPVVVFSGTFTRSVNQENSNEVRIGAIAQTLNEWPRDFATYEDIINSKFLSSNVTVLPDAIAMG